jgi:hypothetical protein
MGHDPKRRKPTRDDITDTIPGLLTLFRRGAGLLIPSSLAEGSARTLPDGSSTELPTKEPTGVVGVTTGCSEAEETAGLDTYPGAAPLLLHDLAGGEPQAEALEPEALPQAGWWFAIRLD